MSMPNIDWNELILESQRKRNSRETLRGSEFWDMRAPAFARHASETGYAEKFMEIMGLDKSMSVLDMGCGGGTMAIPLSGVVKEITAVDFSGNMIEIVRDKCRQQGIDNIKTIHASWEDDWQKAGIGTCDVAIASRSMSIEDYREGITKLNNAARKRVYISTVVGDGPHDRRIIEAVGRKLNVSIDYIYIYNLIHQMGIHGNICFIKENTVKSFEDHETALESCRWMLHGMTPEEEVLLRAFLKEHLIKKDGRWVLDYARKHKWAVIWWNKEQEDE